MFAYCLDQWFRSLSNGVYKLQNNDSLEQFEVYCHMSELPGSLVMKMDDHNVTKFH